MTSFLRSLMEFGGCTALLVAAYRAVRFPAPADPVGTGYRIPSTAPPVREAHRRGELSRWEALARIAVEAAGVAVFTAGRGRGGERGAWRAASWLVLAVAAIAAPAHALARRIGVFGIGRTVTQVAPACPVAGVLPFWHNGSARSRRRILRAVDAVCLVAVACLLLATALHSLIGARP